MDVAACVGYEMIFVHSRFVLTLAIVLGLCGQSAVHAEDSFTLIVSGASGGAHYAERYEGWRSRLVAALRERPGFQENRLRVLAETPGPGIGRASREGVRDAIFELGRRMKDDSVLSILLFGHGTFDGRVAKFNLVGPDLEAIEWKALLDSIPGYVVFVNTGGASFPFIEALAGDRRVVISATASQFQRYDTVFPEFFVEALSALESDIDKDYRVSVFEAFEFSSKNVRRWYRREGRLATERALIDDSGDGVGKEVDGEGSDGTLAARLFIGAERREISEVSDKILGPLFAEQAVLESEISNLRINRPAMSEADYRDILERLLIELASVSREIRRRIPK